MKPVIVFALGTAAFGCNTVLGIEEAQVDPRLEVQEGTLGSETLEATDDEESDAGEDDTESTDGAGIEDEASDGEVTEDADEGESSDEAASDAVSSDSEVDDAPEPAESDAFGDMGLDGAGGQPSDDETEAEPEASLCEQYCDEIQELCTGELAQYRDMLQCMTVCEYLPEGEITSNDNSNTVACRLRHVSNARYAAGTEHEAYCRQAGPGGDGRCGTNCEGYCTLMMGVCNEDDADIYHFDSEADCLSACEDLPASDETYSTTNVEIADGNHVQCRLFHVTSAAMLDPEEHCEHSMGITLCEAPDEVASEE